MWLTTLRGSLLDSIYCKTGPCFRTIRNKLAAPSHDTCWTRFLHLSKSVIGWPSVAMDELQEATVRHSGSFEPVRRWLVVCTLECDGMCIDVSGLWQEIPKPRRERRKGSAIDSCEILIDTLKGRRLELPLNFYFLITSDDIFNLEKGYSWMMLWAKSWVLQFRMTLKNLAWAGAAGPHLYWRHRHCEHGILTFSPHVFNFVSSWVPMQGVNSPRNTHYSKPRLSWGATVTFRIWSSTSCWTTSTFAETSFKES